MFVCENCGENFTLEHNLKRHTTRCGGEAQFKFKCSRCEKFFNREDNRARHEKKCGSKKRCHVGDGSTPVKKQRCDFCDTEVPSLQNHYKSLKHKQKEICENYDDNTKIIVTAFKNRIISYRLFSDEKHLTPDDFMEHIQHRVIKLIQDKISIVESAVKVNLELFALCSKWQKGDDGEKETQEIKSFNTKNRVLQLNEDDISGVYSSFIQEIRVKTEEFQERDSGWALQEILYLELNINKFSPLKGSSYLPSPEWIKNKRACVNVINSDDACFAWAVVSALCPVDKNAERVTSYPHYKEILDLSGIQFPMSFAEIKRFEHNNDISINIFDICEKNTITLIYHTQQKREIHINLLLIEEGEKSHYIWIKNLSRLVRAQMTKYEHQMFICDGCLLSFTTKEKLMEHSRQDCAHVKTILPLERKNILKFKNFAYQMRAPVVVYADFEALLTPIATAQPNPHSSFTMNYQEHRPYSFGFYIKCGFDDSLSRYVHYRGTDCMSRFITSLKTELAPYAKVMSREISMHPLSDAQIEDFSSAVKCSICGEEMGEDKVHDHDHLTGEYRGAAHSDCNLNFKMKPIIPIVLHNLSKYDSHFIIRELKDYDATILPKNKENFISFTIKNPEMGVNFRFIDSYRFLSSSLDKLASNLEPQQLVTIRSHFPQHVELMRRKGVFPYDYVSNWEKLNDTSLPPISAFYNTLSKTDISPTEYIHAQKVWNTFGISTLGEYADLYLKTDVLLLADIFENFRNVCLGTYKLDPAHYFTAPGLSWDAMLRTTKVQMELLTDLSMIKFLSIGIRGGLSQCCGKYATANNKYIEGYNADKPSNFIVYLDANNQYGWAMSQHIPLKDFHWLSKGEIENFQLNSIPSDADTGYILEVDIEYPAHLHHSHNDFCFCPENRIPEVSGATTRKLISCLHVKNNYIIHYLNLKQALEHGLVCKKIHRILAFTQSQWLKPYIDMNTEKRTLAKNSFEKDFYKLMNNAVFGKTMENVEKRVDIRLINQWESAGRKLGARALIGRLNFHSSTVIGEDLIIIQMNKNSVKYDKPIYVGFTVLELSKTLMYDFHYGYMKRKYGDKVQLLYTDTDSFIYNVQTEDFYSDIRPDVHCRFDTSDFSENNIYNLPLANKKVLGMFKDEYNGRIICEFIGIRSKCYFVRGAGEEIKKIKGIKKQVVQDEISRDDFYRCVSGKDDQYRTMSVITSKAHLLYTQALNKLALRNYDDKRFSRPDALHQTLAWGHRDIDRYNFI